MIKKYKYGFEYKGFIFGWREKELYRLSAIKKKRNYSEKKLNQIVIGNKVGYRICSDRKTLEQLSDLTHFINMEKESLISEDLPF